MFQIYTKTGRNYEGYDNPDLWSLIGEGSMVRESWPAKTKFPSGSITPQLVNPGETRAFYIAFLECSGTWPLAVDQGTNYSLGTRADDGNLAIMEGIKMGSTITRDDPFNSLSNWKPYYCKYIPMEIPGISHGLTDFRGPHHTTTHNNVPLQHTPSYLRLLHPWYWLLTYNEG